MNYYILTQTSILLGSQGWKSHLRNVVSALPLSSMFNNMKDIWQLEPFDLIVLFSYHLHASLPPLSPLLFQYILEKNGKNLSKKN